MFVSHQRKYLHRFKRQRVGVDLAIGTAGHFDGVGIMILSHPDAPNFLFLCYPTFLAPKDTCCTVTNGAFLKYSGFSRVLIDTWHSAHFEHKSGVKFSLPLTTKNAIDYISFNVHTTSPAYRRAEKQCLEYRSLALQPVGVDHPSVRGTWAHSWALHIRYGHRSINSLQKMIDAGYLKGRGIPDKLAPIPFRCGICDAAGATKLRRGPLVDTSKLPVGVLWHIDFTFFNETSIRGFTSALVIVEATERMVFFFPCRHKNPPIDLVLFFFSWLRRHGVPVADIRSDEDGAFVRSTEFCKILYKSLGIVLQSTGGYASTINGKAESPHMTIKRMIRAMLIGASMLDIFWCFAGQYAANIHNNCINRITGKPPALGFAKKLVPVTQIFPFGSRVRIIKDLTSQRALAARTAGDLRSPLGSAIYPAEVDNLPSTGAYDALFLGWSSNPAVSLLYKQGDKSNRILRGHHIIVDPYGVSHNPSVDSLRPNEVMFQLCFDKSPGPYGDPSSSPPASTAHLRRSPRLASRDPAGIEWNIALKSSSLDTVASAFPPEDCEAFDITLPPANAGPLGLLFTTDEDYLAPILMSISPESPLSSEIPRRHQFARSWITWIHNERPLTGNGAREIITNLRGDKPRTISIEFCTMVNPVRHTYEQHRAFFDSCIGLRHAHMAILPYTPPTPRTFHKGMTSDESHHWKQSAFSQYNKNAKVGLLSQPVPIEKIPRDRTILRPVLAPKIKSLGSDQFEFVARLCADGSRQVKGIDFEASWAPVIGACPYRLTLAWSASRRLELAIVDVENCFQNTMVPEDERCVLHLPPYYMEWFTREYPGYKLDTSPSGRYVLVAMKGIQGEKPVGRKWYLLIKKILRKFNCISCPEEPALYIYDKDDGYMIINTSTDDFLCAYSDRGLFHRFVTYLRNFFGITTQEGPVLSYLNMRIVQSSHGISYDQTEHIQNNIINYFFPPDSCEKIKAAHTPFRTDSQFETDLAEQLPAQGKDLEDLETEFKGSFSKIMGMFMHIYCWTRDDLGYPMSRYGRYIHAANRAAFEGLKWIARYLATHRHRPIMYPRRSIDGYHTLRVDFDPPHFEEIELPNSLIFPVDSDHARDLRTRRSCHHHKALLNGVAVDWKHDQERCISLHSTEAEVRGVFACVKRGMHTQDVSLAIGIPRKILLPSPVYEDSEPCIDILDANEVTSRVKHVAVPIHFIHDQIRTHGRFVVRKISTRLNPADSGTKPNPSPAHFRHYDYSCGVRFYPPQGSDHYKLLQLDLFVTSPYSKHISPSSSPTS